MEVVCHVVSKRGIHCAINEDSVSLQVVKIQRRNIVFAIVCDGVGGLPCGEWASAYTVNQLRMWFMERYLSFEGLLTQKEMICELNQVLMRCNRKLYLNEERGATTVTAFLSCDSKYVVAHIGDSRLYYIDRQIQQLTWDHTLCGEKHHILTRCLGKNDNQTIDYHFGNVKRKSSIVLCSDGFHQHRSVKEIKKDLYSLKEGEKVERSTVDDCSIVNVRYE